MKPLVRNFLFAIVLAVSLATTCLCQIRPVPLGTTPRPEVFAVSRQTVALLPDSRFATVWSDRTSVYLQIVDVDGTPVFESPGLVVSAASQSTKLNPVVVADTQEGPARQRNGPTSLRGQRLGPDGHLLWGAEGRLVYKTRSRGSDSFSPGLQGMPDGNGGAVLAFDDGSGSPLIDDRDVIALRVSGAGESLWGNGVMVASGPKIQVLDSLVPGPDGGFFVGVLNLLQGFVAFHRFTADGQRLWPEDGVPILDPASSALGDIDWFTYGAFAGDSLRFVWEHDGADGVHSDIRYGALDLAGNRLTGAAGISLTDSANHNATAGFAFDPKSGASFMVWQSSGETDSNTLGAIYNPGEQ